MEGTSREVVVKEEMTEVDEVERKKEEERKKQREYYARRTPQEKARREEIRIARRTRELELIAEAKVDPQVAKDLEVIAIMKKHDDRRKREAEMRRLRRKKAKEKDPEKYEEALRQLRAKHREKRERMPEEQKKEEKMKNYFYRQAYLAKHGRSWDQKEENIVRRRQKATQWRHSLEGEKRERYYQNVAKAVKKYLQKTKEEQPEKWREQQEKSKEYQRMRYTLETPQQRQRRRWKDKVCGVKRKLKKQLEEQGVDKEEIERRLLEVWERMWREFEPEGAIPKPRRGKARREEKEGGEEELEGSGETTPRLVAVDPGESVEVVFEEVDFFEETGPPSPPSPVVSLSEPSPKIAAISASPLPTLQCPHCENTFPDHRYLRSHILCKHPSKCWKCPKCMEVMLSPTEFQSHFQTAHKKVPGLAQEVLKKETEIKSEVPSTSKLSLKFICVKCPPLASASSQFESRQELFGHVKRRHPKDYWPCKHCNLLKYSQDALKLHQVVCQPKKKKEVPKPSPSRKSHRTRKTNQR